MKMRNWVIGLIILFSAASCLDTTEETTVNEDGSGLYVNTADMGQIFGMLKNMGGGGDDMKGIDKVKMDTVIYFKELKDSMTTLSEDEKKIIEAGNMRIVMNYENEKFNITFSIPFTKTEEVGFINKVLAKSRMGFLEDQMKKVMPSEKGDDAMGGMEVMGNGKGESESDISDYFDYEYSASKLTKKLNKEKYANLAKDKSLTSMQEMSGMGIPINFKNVINLPRPVKNATGKGVKLSDDKKKITIEATLDDFFENASVFEYEIEY
jgi:hypothetical protein